MQRRAWPTGSWPSHMRPLSGPAGTAGGAERPAGAADRRHRENPLYACQGTGERTFQENSALTSGVPAGTETANWRF